MLVSSWRSEVPLADLSADGTQPRVLEKLILGARKWRSRAAAMV